MMVEELKHVQGMERRRYDVVVDNERNLVKTRDECEQLKFKCEDLENINTTLVNKVKELVHERAALENENNMFKYGSKNYLSGNYENKTAMENDNNNMSKRGSQNYLSGNYENKENSFPNTLETTSVPTAQRFNSFDSSKNNNGTNHNIQQLNNEKILAERNPNQMGYLSSSNVNKHHGSEDFSQKLTNHELTTQNSSKLSTTKINSYHSTC